MKKFLPAALFVIFGFSFVYSADELQNLDFLARYSVLNSSAFAEDTAALFLNPAGLGRISRMNFIFSTSPSLTINFLGLSSMIPLLGGTIGGGYYNLMDNSKRGLALGWGREVTGSLSLGFALKTVSRDPSLSSSSFLFDAGLIFYPNETMGWSLFKNSWLNNKLFLSMAIQNIGISSLPANAEDLNLRLGMGYYLKPLWTKLFVEKNLFNTNDRLILGLEFNPEAAFLKFLNLRVSYNFQDLNAGCGIKGDDASLDASYSTARNAVCVSFNVYFEKTRQKLSLESTDIGIRYYNEAREMDNSGDDDAFSRYYDALNAFESALFYDKENKKAKLYKNQINERFSDYYNGFVNTAREFEEKKDYPSSLAYYNKAFLIDRNDATSKKIQVLSKERSVVSYLQNKKASISSFIKSRKYLAASKEIQKVLAIVPNDPDAKRMEGEIAGKLDAISQRYYNKALNFYDKEMYEECIAQAKISLQYNRDFDRADDLINLAAAEITQKKGMDQAWKRFKNKDYLGTLRMVGWILSRNPRSQDAQDLKEKTIRALKENAKAYLESGIEKYNQSQYEEAVQEFDKVLVVDTNNNTANDYRNRALSKMKAIEKLDEIEEE
jgi:tetratricopeptide (TPR) repeat protein